MPPMKSTIAQMSFGRSLKNAPMDWGAPLLASKLIAGLRIKARGQGAALLGLCVFLIQQKDDQSYQDRQLIEFCR
jgi:hypothetical protein